jgi:hypothetical protein
MHPDESHLVATDPLGQVASGPFHFDAAAQPALQAYLSDAARAGFNVTISDAFRTYDTQWMVWERKLTEPGIGARPGHSEHELGLAVDLSFADDAQDWLWAHAADHGFVLSYPDGAERVTGFRFEPWHFRFVGVDVARDVAQRPGSTLEELFASKPGLGESGDCSDCTRPESNSSCDGLTEQGTCTGTLMQWCFKGAADAIDCALIGRSCRSDLPRAVCVQ